MTNRNFTALSALALGLVIAASAASAQPYGKGGNYAAARPSAQEEHRSHMRLARCDCSMMSGTAGMRDQCMSMMGDHRDETPQPRQPG